MKTKEFNKKLALKSEAELTKSLAEEREHLRDLRFKASQNQLKTVHAVSTAKKTIARILTALRAKKNETTH